MPALVYSGDTVIVAVTGSNDGLEAVNEGMFPVPEAPSPMDVLELLQLNTEPLTFPVMGTAKVQW